MQTALHSGLTDSLSLRLPPPPSLSLFLSLFLSLLTASLVHLFFLVQLQPLEVMPFIEEILNNIRAIICDLQPHHVHTFYEAVGYMIQAQVVSWINRREREDIEDIPSPSTGQCCSRETDRQIHVAPQRNLGQRHPESNSCEWTGTQGQGHPWPSQLTCCMTILDHQY